MRSQTNGMCYGTLRHLGFATFFRWFFEVTKTLSLVSCLCRCAELTAVCVNFEPAKASNANLVFESDADP